MTSFTDTTSWALRLPLSLRDQLGRLRLRTDVRVLVVDDVVWAQGERVGEEDDSELPKIAGAERFDILSDGLCVPAGSRVPTMPLPEGTWIPLHQWIPVELPVARIPSADVARLPMRLVRTEDYATPDVLLTEITAWTELVVRSPMVRLNRWMFAVASDGRVVVTGTPLPSMPGRRFVRHGSVAVPAGMRPGIAANADECRLDPDTLSRVFGVSDALVLWHEDDAWERIPLSEFTNATRSAARATQRALSDGRPEQSGDGGRHD